MKQYFKFILFFISITCFAQTQWEKFTELSDSTLGYPRPKCLSGFDYKDNYICFNTEDKNRVLLYTFDGLNMNLISIYKENRNSLNSYSSRNGNLRLDIKRNRVFVVDAALQRIQLLTLNGTNLSLVSQYGSEGSSSGQFMQPYDVEILDSTHIVVSDIRLRKLKIIEVINNTFTEITEYSNLGTLVNASPYSIHLCIDSLKRIYIGDVMNKKVDILTFNGTNLSLLTSINHNTNTGINFEQISDITVSDDNKLYISVSNSNLYEYSLSGNNFLPLLTKTTTVQGINQFLVKDNTCYSHGILYLNICFDYFTSRSILDNSTKFTNDFISEKGQLAIPSKIVADSLDRIFVTNYKNNNIQVYSMSGTNIKYLFDYTSRLFSNLNIHSKYYNIAFYQNKLYILESYSNNIEVASINGSNMSYYTSFGGQNLDLASLAIHSKTGNIYASEYTQSKIIILTQDGINIGVKTTLGISGTVVGYLNNPGDIVIANDTLYVVNNSDSPRLYSEIYSYSISNNQFQLLSMISDRVQSKNYFINGDITVSNFGELYFTTTINYNIYEFKMYNIENQYEFYESDSLGRFPLNNLDDPISRISTPIYINYKGFLFVARSSGQIDVYKKKSSLTAINDPKSKSHIDFTIYPNPTNSTFTISAVGNQNIQITNAIGKEVYTNYNYIPQTKIDLSQEPTGIYFVKVGTTVKKLLLR